MCPHSRQSKPSIRTGRCTVPRAEARGYITRRARCVTFGPDVRRSGPVCGVRGQCVAFRADAWRCEGIGLVPTYRIPRIRTTQGTTRGLGGGRTVRKRHVTERRRRTIARERRAHRHVSRRRSLLGAFTAWVKRGFGGMSAARRLLYKAVIRICEFFHHLLLVDSWRISWRKPCGSSRSQINFNFLLPFRERNS